jgi:transposase
MAYERLEKQQYTAVCRPEPGKNIKGLGGKKTRRPVGTSGDNVTTGRPDKIVPLRIDRLGLSEGKWKETGWEKRQVIDMEIHRVVTEYRAEIVENERGERLTAPFPEGVVQSAQYGGSAKAHAVYMPVHQGAISFSGQNRESMIYLRYPTGGDTYGYK